MWRVTMTIPVMLIVACAHERAPTQPDAAAARGSGTSIPAQPAHPLPAVAKNAANDSTGSAVNKDLLKQGYHTAMHNGQLVYCRTEQLTGTRFKSQVCLSEAQILDEQQRARETMTTPRPVQCLTPNCS